MPTGIIIKSASHEESDAVRDANVKAVIESAGYEVPEPEPPAEPKREDFKTEEEFEVAHVDWQDKEEEKAAKAEEEEVVAPKKSRRTRAIERATSELQQKVKDLEAKLEAAGGLKEKQPEAPKEALRPKRAEFATDEAYEDALLAWAGEKAIQQKALKDAEAANQTRFEQNIQTYAAQVEEAKDRYEDWDEVVNQEIFIGKEVQLAILENQENAAEVIYYLGRHPAYAKKLGEMSPLSAVMEVGRLGMKLLTGAPATGEANSEGQTKPKPRVPAPVRPVNTGGPSANPTAADIAARPNYPGKFKDFRAALAKG